MQMLCNSYLWVPVNMFINIILINIVTYIGIQLGGGRLKTGGGHTWTPENRRYHTSSGSKQN